MNDTDKQWKTIYKIGAIATIFVLCGIILDMVVGSVTGGNVAALPQSAIGRYNQFKENRLLGLYNMDLLNIVNQIILIPSIFALYAVHRNTKNPFALLSLIIFLVGTTIFVTGNTALTMLDLSHKYFDADSDGQRLLYAAAGEAMLTKGSHGSLGVFIGFVLPTLATALMSGVMLSGKIFSRLTSYFGLAGNSLMVIYLILVTFNPAVEKMALIFAMPAGLLAMAWMIMYTIELFKLSRIND
jgi:hypothetical protein